MQVHKKPTDIQSKERQSSIVTFDINKNDVPSLLHAIESAPLPDKRNLMKLEKTLKEFYE